MVSNVGVFKISQKLEISLFINVNEVFLKRYNTCALSVSQSYLHTNKEMNMRDALTFFPSNQNFFFQAIKTFFQVIKTFFQVIKIISHTTLS